LLRSSGQLEFFLAMETLTLMARSRGATDQARRLLAEAAAERDHTYGSTHWSGGFWTKLGADFVAILRQQRREKEAERFAADLRGVLRQADPRWPPYLAIVAPPVQ
jgi:hypothetical protein